MNYLYVKLLGSIVEGDGPAGIFGIWIRRCGPKISNRIGWSSSGTWTLSRIWDRDFSKRVLARSGKQWLNGLRSIRSSVVAPIANPCPGALDILEFPDCKPIKRRAFYENRTDLSSYNSQFLVPWFRILLWDCLSKYRRRLNLILWHLREAHTPVEDSWGSCWIVRRWWRSPLIEWS